MTIRLKTIHLKTNFNNNKNTIKVLVRKFFS